MVRDVSRVAASCQGKERFSAPSLAVKVNRKRAAVGKKCKVYRCEACGGWHLGRGLDAIPKGRKG